MIPTSYLFGSRILCAQTTIFSPEPCFKNAGKSTIVLCGLRLMSRIFEEFHHPAIQTKILGSFLTNKVRQSIGRKDSIQTVIVIQTSRRLDSFLYEAAQYRTLKSYQIFKTYIKKFKTYSG
jgi:hypothetical protein